MHQRLFTHKIVATLRIHIDGQLLAGHKQGWIILATRKTEAIKLGWGSCDQTTMMGEKGGSDDEDNGAFTSDVLIGIRLFSISLASSG